MIDGAASGRTVQVLSLWAYAGKKLSGDFVERLVLELLDTFNTNALKCAKDVA